MSKIQYQNYQSTRDLVWKILVQNNVCELPVKISSICKNMDIRLKSYSNSKLLMKIPFLKKDFSNNDGFSFLNTIFYNQACSVGRQRFTVAHELLHVIKHESSMKNCEPAPQDSEKETEANIFASRLLAPACVLWALDVHTAEEISQICNISLTSAKFRLERLNLLYEREKYFIKTRGYSCFLQSPLEKQVYKQFIPYINNYK